MVTKVFASWFLVLLLEVVLTNYYRERAVAFCTALIHQPIHIVFQRHRSSRIVAKIQHILSKSGVGFDCRSAKSFFSFSSGGMKSDPNRNVYGK